MSVLTIERRDAVEIATLNRPEVLNALSTELAESLSNYFTELKSRHDVRVVLLRGAGRAFCAGADLNSPVFKDQGPGRMQRKMDIQRMYSGIVRAMRVCPQPIISLVHGAAAGGGFSLALASDVRIATPDAKMNGAFLRIGLGGGDMGSGYFLPRVAGLSLASELLLTGNFIHADRALATGLVSKIVPYEELLETGLALASDMLKASPMGLRMTKDLLNQVMDAPSLEAELAIEDRQQVVLLETADHAEAVAAFMEKRAPVYRNQ